MAVHAIAPHQRLTVMEDDAPRRSGHFAIVPSNILDDTRKEIGLPEIRMLVALASYADSDGWCSPSQGTLAERLGTSRRAVLTAIKNLSKCGYVEVHERHDPRNNARLSSEYRVVRDHALSADDCRTLRSVGHRGSPRQGRPPALSGTHPLRSPGHRGGAQQDTPPALSGTQPLYPTGAQQEHNQRTEPMNMTIEQEPTETSSPPAVARTAKKADPKKVFVRCPDDFQPPESFIEAAMEKHGVTREWLDTVTEEFVNYWTGTEKGSKEKRVDWSLSWRTWVNREVGNRSASRSSNGAYRNHRPIPSPRNPSRTAISTKEV